MTWAVPLGGSSGPWDESAADQAAWAGWLGSYSARGFSFAANLGHSIWEHVFRDFFKILSFFAYPRVFTISGKG